MVAHIIDFENGVIGEVHFKENSIMNSTNEVLKEEYKCYLIKDKYKTYLNSFNRLSKATEYLIHLSNAKNEKFVW